MANRYTYTNPITKEQILEDYFKNNMTQTELAEKYGTTQKIVWRLFKTYGLIARVAKKRNQYDENNDMWKGGITNDHHGYTLNKCADHPRAKECGGYVPEHILVMEKHIGRYLNFNGTSDPTSEVVHHMNEIKSDNRIENLQLMTIGEHSKLHANFLKRRTGGDLNVRERS